MPTDVTAIAKSLTGTLLAHGVTAAVGFSPAAMAKLWQNPKAKVKPEFLDTPAYISFPVQRAAGTSISDVMARRPELADDLGRLMQRSVSLRFGQAPFSVEVLKRKEDVGILPFVDSPYKQLEPLQYVLGRTWEYGKPIDRVGQLTDPNSAHLMAAGMTGSGKSVALLGAVASLCYSTSPAQLELYVIDLKNRTMRPIAELPHVKRFAYTNDDAAAVVAHVERLLDDRKDNGLPAEPHVVLLVDEFRELQGCGSDVLDRAIPRLVNLGRELGIHVFGATQRPLAKEIGSVAKSQIGVRLVGRVHDGNEARHIIGRGDSGAESLPGRGAMILSNDEGMELVQSFLFCPKADKATVMQVTAQIAQRWPEYGRTDAALLARPAQAAAAADGTDLGGWLRTNYDKAKGKLRHGKKAELAQLLGYDKSDYYAVDQALPGLLLQYEV